MRDISTHTPLARRDGEGIPPDPITREELFLAKLAGSDVPTPEPITRKEYLLKECIEHGGGGGLDITGAVEIDVTASESISKGDTVKISENPSNTALFGDVAGAYSSRVNYKQMAFNKDGRGLMRC